MIDRLEELLALLEERDEEEETLLRWADVLPAAAAARPVRAGEEELPPLLSGHRADGVFALQSLPRRGAEESALPALYRQVAAEGDRQAVGPLRRVTVTELRDTPGETVTPEELDRIIRRDSRRYDGGMTIY